MTKVDSSSKAKLKLAKLVVLLLGSQQVITCHDLKHKDPKDQKRYLMRRIHEYEPNLKHMEKVMVAIFLLTRERDAINAIKCHKSSCLRRP